MRQAATIVAPDQREICQLREPADVVQRAWLVQAQATG